MQALLRIIDANANRAAEGLRAAEDIARFVLAHASLSQRIKGLRHGLAAALERASETAEPSAPLTRESLLHSRDASSDVGTEAAGGSELSPTSRSSVRDSAQANMARAAEALRSIEESLKLMPGAQSHARAFEQLRYASYDVARDLVLRCPSAEAGQPRLCVIISTHLCRPRSWSDVLRQCLQAGAGAVQLREKSLRDAQLVALGRAARAEIDRLPRASTASPGHRPTLWINDRPDIAAIVGADGVHLGRHDLATPDARAVLGTAQLVGRSASSLAMACEAVADGADLLGLGAMFPTRTKADPNVVGPALLREVLADPVLRDRPHLAVGGIDAGTIHTVIDAGARGVAVSSAVCCAAEPGAVVQALLRAFER